MISVSHALTDLVIALTRRLSPAAQRRVGVTVIRTLRVLLRRRLETNLQLALAERHSAEAADRYFDRLAVCAGWSLPVFHQGIARAGVVDLVRHDESVALLDAAVAERRGVVIAVPHWICYELAGAIIHRRHRGFLVIRESADRRRQRTKERWYEALAVETIRRPRTGSSIADARALLEVLRGGYLLGITPDVVVGPHEGVPVRMLGRTVHLRRGAIALARLARAPLLSFTPSWQAGRLSLRWHREPDSWAYDGGAEDDRRGLQSWCDFIETHLVRHPEDWLFWLDKRWTRAIRGPRGHDRLGRHDRPAAS